MVEDRSNFDRNEWSVSTIGTRLECSSPNMFGIHILHASLTLILEESIELISRIFLKYTLYLTVFINNISILILIYITEIQRTPGIVTFIQCRRYFKQKAVCPSDRLMEYGVCALRGGGIRLQYPE